MFSFLLLSKKSEEASNRLAQMLSGFSRMHQKKFLFVISDLALKEIEKHCFCNKEAVIDLLAVFEIQLEFVRLIESDKELSKRLFAKGVHNPDCIHAALAINHCCEALVTFNKKDFSSVKIFPVWKI